ncbi:hypothetical protein OIHEL45_02715 [Sulfitobacter indolifex HEL-45]|uniref:Uncharacterized protein n=1 Tax=Sulfitobacter indolifex HEL-45 TaxID=391624 RepID=A0ABM9X893_9RHOB|nr:hypothetical protein OIHEL45_02715 [Sulfitobacter indolifex HEL-45]
MVSLGVTVVFDGQFAAFYAYK